MDHTKITTHLLPLFAINPAGKLLPQVPDKGEAGLQCSVTQEKAKEITFGTGSSFSVTCCWGPDPKPHPKPALPLNDSNAQSHLKTQTSYQALQ